jgi:hypothetical protein
VCAGICCATIVSVEELVPTSGRRIDVMALRPK